jgi:hypothetical protein
VLKVPAMIAVGTLIAERRPRRTERAQFGDKKMGSCPFVAGKPPVRICEGEAEWSSYSTVSEGSADPVLDGYQLRWERHALRLLIPTK